MYTEKTSETNLGEGFNQVWNLDMMFTWKLQKPDQNGDAYVLVHTVI